ncbi:MAG: hypothetical protein LBQ54_13570 [Planctomycetaceae bacterium]|nr:hypothetical protein [Planctomycetaceae bacterium]
MKHLRLLLLLTIFLTVGCHRSSIPGLVSAQGKVLFDGAPVNGVNIVFTPSSGSASDRFATAVSKDDGTFLLETAGSAGVVPGQYDVTLVKTTTTSKVSPEEEERLLQSGKPVPEADIVYHIPWKYGNAQLSGITVEIGQSGKKDILLELQPDKTPLPVRPKI